MSKQKEPYRVDLENFKETGCLALDTCARAIIQSRKSGKWIVEIVLSKSYYGILKRWVYRMFGEEAAESEFYLDGVLIREESIITGKSYQFFYERPRKEAKC